MCEECLRHAIATVFDKEQQSWYFSPHTYDYESFVAGQDKLREYSEQYEIINAINPGKFGVEWVRKVVEGGRTAQVVTLEETLELLRIAKAANPDGNLIGMNDTCICKRSRGGDISEPICMFLLHRPKDEDALPGTGGPGTLRKTGEDAIRQLYDPGDTDKMKEMLLDFERRLGLVHSVFTIAFPHIITLCNCEMPYCHSMRQRFLYGIPEAFVEGYYVASVSNDKCTGCGKCVPQCQFGAIKLDRKLNMVTTMPARCMGCGICRSVCPTDAIQMQERKKVTLLPVREPVGLRHMKEQEGSTT